jgi:hypothetical protein
MEREFRVGDHVEWNSEAGRVRGRIKKKFTSETEFKGYTRHASKESPQYLIKSDKTDHLAMHKGTALKKIRFRSPVVKSVFGSPRKTGATPYHPFVPSESTATDTQSPRWLDLVEEELLRSCRFDHFRGPGPGGQKRNKTSNSVRITHPPTGLSVIAGESRSLQENRLRAVRRLKLRLAVEVRHAIDPRGWEPPAWFGQVVQLGRLAVSHRNEHYARTAALVLDLLDARKGSVGDVAKLLSVSTSSVVKFLESEPSLWTAANALRKSFSQRPLEERR